MKMINLEGDIITLRASRHEMETLEVSMRAGKDIDPFIRHAGDEEVQALHIKVKSLLNAMHSVTVEFPLSKMEFLDISSILEALSVTGIENYYPHMVNEFPPEDALDAFTKHVSGIYDDAFPIDR